MTTASPIKKRSARRCLFGRPNPTIFLEKLNNELSKIQEQQAQKWGFDFEHCLPMPSSSSAFKYIPINPATVPEYYRAKVSMTPSKRVLDENKSPEVSPLASDISIMDCSTDEESFRSPRNKNSPKKRRSDQRRITDVFPAKRKHLQQSPKRLEPVVPVSPPRMELTFPSI